MDVYFDMVGMDHRPRRVAMRVVVILLMRFTSLVSTRSRRRRDCNMHMPMVLVTRLLSGMPARRLLNDIFHHLGTLLMVGTLSRVPSSRHLDVLGELGRMIIVARLLPATTAAGLAILICLLAVAWLLFNNATRRPSELSNCWLLMVRGLPAARWLLSCTIFEGSLTPIYLGLLYVATAVIVRRRVSLWSETVPCLLVNLHTRLRATGLSSAASTGHTVPVRPISRVSGSTGRVAASLA